MKKLTKLLNIEMDNVRRSIISENDIASSVLLQKLSSLAAEADILEDIEYREYVSDDEYYLYNIHSTEDTLYAEKYDAIMTEETEADLICECKCITVPVDDVIDLILKD